jgi:hypothetical protein
MGSGKEPPNLSHGLKTMHSKNRVLQFIRWLTLVVGVSISPPDSALGQTSSKLSHPDSAAGLIIQLGSPTFSEREEANKALRKMGTKALPPLREAARQGKDLEIRRRAALLVDQIENSLEGLLEFYCEFGLPLPPAGARLVCFNTGWSGGSADGKTVHFQALGFVLHPEKEGIPPVLLVGTEEYARTTENEKYDGKLKLIDVDPDEVLPDQVRAQWQKSGFEVNAGLATALQCKAEGYDAFARILWDRFVKDEMWQDDCIFHQPANLAPRRAVAQLAWAHFGNELLKPTSDRASIGKKVKSLMKAEPSMASKKNLDFLKSLELTLVPSRARADSIERLIDDLTELSGRWTNPGDREADPCYRRLFEVGFASVPDLINHLDDPRLTRVRGGGIHHSPLRICTVGEFVQSVLYGVAGFDVLGQWRNGHTDPIGEKEDARKWFIQAQKGGEEAYYTKHFFPADSKDERFNSCMFHLIAVKYPAQLPAIYRKILDTKNELPSGKVVEALVESKLPAAEKTALLTYATKNAKQNHREAAIWALKQMEKKKTQPEGKQGR